MNHQIAQYKLRLLEAIARNTEAIARNTEAIANRLERLERLARRLETAAPAPAPAPNFRRSLSEFTGFDWKAIGAKVMATDEWGATTVEWRGHRFVRRSPDNKFGAAIWYSRATGEGYERLITFASNAEPTPISRGAAQALRR